MSILITGANGAIGADLINSLSKKNKIFAIYRTKNKNVKKEKNISWIKHDLKNEFKKKLNPKPKIVIHCAVIREFSKENSLKSYYDSNIRSLKNITAYSKKNKIDLIINFSTISIYGKVKKKNSRRKL